MNGRSVFLALLIVCAIVALIAIFGSGRNSEASSENSSILKDAKGLHFIPDELVHVAMVIRHTVRAPRIFPPNDPLLNEDLFPRGIARSTRLGLIATQNATQRWREWYKDFLKGDIDEVYARTSTMSRCYETLSMILNTWYPSPDDIPLSQVAIRMMPKGNDKYIENCGTMKYITKGYDPNTKIPDEIVKVEGIQTIGDFIDFLKTKTGLHNETVNFFYMAYMEGFVSLECETWRTKDEHWLARYRKTSEFSRLYLLHNSLDIVGPYYGHHFMHGLADQLEKVANKQSSVKLSLFVYHDLNLLAIMRALGIHNEPVDPLAVLALELWKKPEQNRYYVKLRFSRGLSTDWKYADDKFLNIKRGDDPISELGSVNALMRNFYKDTANFTECGYFGGDAKI